VADSKPTTDVAVFDPTSSQFPALFAQEGEGSVAEVIADNFGDEGFSVSNLDRLTVPAGGGQAWDIPDEDPSRFVEGVIIHRQPNRAFWFKTRGEDGDDDGPPDCYSTDNKVGIGAFGPGSENNPTGACASCPMNVFGSSQTGSGNGKACKEQMQLFLLQPGSVLPIQVSLPPTSLQPWKKYMTRLASKGKSYYAVVTRLGLIVTKGGGQTYSVVDPAKASDLAPAEASAARAYGATIKGFLEAAAAERIANARSDGSDAASGDAPGKTAPLEESVR
jgi:hypothetical protein